MQTLEITGPRSIDWAAGIFEGEGTLTVDYVRKGVPRYKAQIGLTDYDVLQSFHDIIQCGNLNGPYKFPSSKKHHKPIWIWKLSKKKDLKGFLETMLPYLGHRRELKAKKILKTLNATN
tara:strand:+ start:89 stop:445 length:357 start_codon:yes stop_codon:yes gene_type:complete